LNLNCDILVSKFAFKFNLYRYAMNPAPAAAVRHNRVGAPRGAGVGSNSKAGHAGGRGGVPYHNVIHACDVLQSTYAYLYIGGVAAALNARQQLAMILAAVVHDVGHPVGLYKLNPVHP
jgi:hypothetical protein